MSGEPRFFIHRMVERAFRRFRPGRLRFFYEQCGISARTRVLDLGGMPYFWELAGELGLPLPRVTIVNLLPPPGPLPDCIRWLVADARKLPFRDQVFDVAFANSVIEHVGEEQDQRAFAGEVQRVARSYFVQTPSRRFPVETHLVTLFLHWLPKPQQKRWMRRLSLAGTNGKLPQDVLEKFLDDLRLLDARQLAEFFPEAEVRIERFLGLEKSLLAYRRAEHGVE